MDDTLYTSDDVENYYRLICRSVKSSDKCLPRAKYKKSIKPYWNNELKRLKTACMELHKKWTSKDVQEENSMKVFGYTKMQSVYSGRNNVKWYEKQRRMISKSLVRLPRSITSSFGSRKQRDGQPSGNYC
ncbi:Hypothetical predicted protein [Paramuricea clavata]|uniref:Uncharacterized protein n=1 Tax=Paramuricea clavata TaxID=317549 RepID=A0A6S7GYD4_PARCT|nr:Hypothetical predicted protein [Paramuricea clavata]